MQHGPANIGRLCCDERPEPRLTGLVQLSQSDSKRLAGRAGVPPDKVLPVSSRKLSDGTFEVQLTSGASNFIRIVDDNASVISLNPA